MRKGISLFTNLVFFLMLTGSGSAMGIEKPITKEMKLSNGLKIVVREDHRSPVVVSQIWYKVGSSDELRWKTGISHALEHMMFQGTSRLPGDGFAQLISKLGGQNNAFTAEDYTAYYEELDAAHLATSFEFEADRMTNLVLSPQAFANEIKVVIEERHMRTDDNPQHMTWERFMAHANPMGPYHHPVVGWQQDLDHMKVEDLREWYQKWYAPNNAVVVVVGDVNAENVFKLAEQYFGTIPARALPVEGSQKDIIPLGEKRIKVHLPAKLPYIIWGFAVPTIKTTDPEEAYALFALSAVLDGGQSARFARNLIRGQQVAAKIDASYDPFKKYETQFVIAGTPSQGHSIAEFESKVMEQIELLKHNLVSNEELQRVKNQLLAQEVFEKDSTSSQATTLGMLEAVGLSWKLADEFPEKIRNVTPEQIQKVAQKYFLPKQMTVAQLVPE